ncbi:hypothetical protein [Streptococcus pneumoniae]|uniref:hypothetical protein n=1 Tax=Streptococcus pneumoniae TaxID=1313 RepID=UPI000990C7A9|nr:hypothetical protein [Streptococcus pneumoniae]
MSIFLDFFQILFVKILTLWYSNNMKIKCKGFNLDNYFILQLIFYKRKELVAWLFVHILNG